MTESLIVLVIIVTLFMFRLITSAQNVVWFQWGVALIVSGLALGVPTGFYYHLLLWRLVSVRASLPKFWWLSPQKLHGLLSPDERRKIMKWFTVGGAGFMITLAGCFAALLGLA